MEMKRFLEELSSSAPTPGGGSASALAGAASASLVAMVAGLSSREGQAGRKEMKAMKKKAMTLQKKLFRAIDEDARSFDAVMKAFRLPRHTEGERFRRSKAIQNAYQKATLTPQRVCHHSLQLLQDSKVLISKGNPNAISDAGVAAFLADAALSGGLLNIGINLTAISDKTFSRKMNGLMSIWEKRRNRLMKQILSKLVRLDHA